MSERPDLKLSAVPPEAFPVAAGVRSAARTRFEATAFPSARHEEWRFTSLRSLWNTGFDQDATASAAALLAEVALPETDGRRIVFVNGRLDPTLTDFALEGVRMQPLSQALAGPSPASSVFDTAHTFSGDWFADLNTGWFTDGVFLHASRHAAPQGPIGIYHLVTAADALVLPRVLFLGETGSEVSLIEFFAGSDGIGYLTVPFTETVLADNARLHHYRIQEDGDLGAHINRCGSLLGRDADLQSFTISLGGRLFRNDFRAMLNGEGGHATLDGLVLVHGNQISDTHSVLHHMQPNCTSHQLHKCIVDGVGTSVFNGKIFVDSIAQKTDSFQENHNLQLSHHGMVYTKPQLEIFADDVKCSHGATVGQLDDEQMFYLNSRGLSAAETRYLLTLGFASQIVNALPAGSMRDRLAGRVDDYTRKSLSFVPA